MSVLVLPFDPSNGQSIERVSLEGVVYTLRFRWNSRLATWFLDLATADNQSKLLGLPIREGWPTNYPYVGKVSGIPPGVIQALDTTGKHQEPTDVSLGDTVPLYYQES